MKVSTDRIVSLSVDKLIIEITYKSVYDERWRVTSDKIVPERLD